MLTHIFKRCFTCLSTPNRRYYRNASIKPDVFFFKSLQIFESLTNLAKLLDKYGVTWTTVATVSIFLSRMYIATYNMLHVVYVVFIFLGTSCGAFRERLCVWDRQLARQQHTHTQKQHQKQPCRHRDRRQTQSHRRECVFFQFARAATMFCACSDV